MLRKRNGKNVLFYKERGVCTSDEEITKIRFTEKNDEIKTLDYFDQSIKIKYIDYYL